MRTSQTRLVVGGRCVQYAALLLFLSAPLAAQTSEPGAADAPGVRIKTESRLVLVDAVVTGKKDEPVAGLTAQDFHVFEDGKEQSVAAFQAHTGAAIGAASQLQHIVLLFDGRSTDDPRWIVNAAEKFVADNTGPNRLMSVAYYDGGCMTMATQFTTDVGQLQKALEAWPTFRRCPPTPDTQGMVRAGEYARLAKDLAKVHGHKVVALFIARAMRQLGASDVGGVGPAGTGRGGMGNGGMGNGGIAPDGMGAAEPGPRGAMEAAAGDSTPDALTNPNGMQLEFRKADASVFAVEGQSGARAPGWALTLAEKTGGHELSRGNDVLAAFALLGREQDQAYTLAYVPTDSPEGSCHVLKVTVDRPHLKVQGRNLYCNAPEATLASAAPAAAEMESLAAAPQAGNSGASVSLPFFYDAGGAPRIDLAIEIPSPVLEPVEVNGKLQASMDVLGLAYNPAGDVAARFTDRANYSFDNRRQFDEFLRRPLAYEHPVSVAPGSYKFKLIFRTAKDHVGVVEAPLTVDPLDPAQLGMSAIALSHDVQPISADAAQAAIDAGEKPLIFLGKRIAAAGSDVFSKTGIGEAYFEVYEPPAKNAEPVKLTMRLRLFDAPGNQQKGDSGDVDLSALAKSGSRTIPVGLKLPVAILAPGAYRAEITVKDPALGETSRSVQFRVQ